MTNSAEDILEALDLALSVHLADLIMMKPPRGTKANVVRLMKHLGEARSVLKEMGFEFEISEGPS
jgi:hypothetical protein